MSTEANQEIQANQVNPETAENGGLPQFEQPKTSSALTDSSFFLQSAALLLVWSVLIVNEGAIRLIDSNPVAGFDDGGRPPRIVLFLGGLLEVVFGLLGVFLGVAALVFRWYNTIVTIVALIIQTVFGYYVFIVYVFVQPSFVANDLIEPSLPGLSIGQSRFLIVMGILTAFHFCLSLQGGQFIFFSRLISAGTGKDFLKQKSGNVLRGIFWNANLAFSGLWTLIIGGTLLQEIGHGKLDMPFVFPPNVGRLPGMTVWTGLLMLLYGIAGIALVVTKARVPVLYYVVGGYTYLSAFLNFTIVQFGLIPMAPSGAVSVHAGLVFMTVFIGPFFTYLASKENETKEA